MQMSKSPIISGYEGMGNFVNSFEGRLQVGQSPSDNSSVFDPISSHIPVKIKETNFNSILELSKHYYIVKQKIYHVNISTK